MVVRDNGSTETMVVHGIPTTNGVAVRAPDARRPAFCTELRCGSNGPPPGPARAIITPNYNTDTQLQDRHPTTRVASNYKSCIQLQEFHKMRTPSRILKCIQNWSGRRPDSKRQDRHPTTKVPILLQEFLPYYRSSNPTTGVPSLLQEFLSYYRSSFPTTGVPFLLQEFLSYYRSSNPTTGVPSNL